MADILVVDDDESIVTAFERFLNYEGHTFRIAGDAEDALRLMADQLPHVVFMDIRMPGRDGLQTLPQMRIRFPEVYVVMMTAYGTSQTSIDAIRSGAFDYLTKPLDLDDLRAVIAKAIASQRVRDKTTITPVEDAARPPGATLVGESGAMQEVYKLVGRLATNDVPAMIVGERGTGKALVSRTIHHNSARRDQPFLTLDCATTPEAAIETTLFAPLAGTIHLANVEALTPLLQARLARGLDAEGTPGVANEPAGARIIASTGQDLIEGVRSGAFNRGLHEALNVVAIRLPPLRERREDIPQLLWYFIQRFNDELNHTTKGVDQEVLRRLMDYSWPGNVGELERVVKRACIVAASDVITADDMGEVLAEGRFDPQAVGSALARSVRTALHERLVEKSAGTASSPFHDIIDVVESTLIRETLAITNGNQVKAADILGVSRVTLRKKMSSET